MRTWRRRPRLSEATVAQFLFIVSRAAPAQAGYLQHAFAETADVIVDRRVAQRRQRRALMAGDRRQRDRRVPGVPPGVPQFCRAVVRAETSTNPAPSLP